MPLLKGHVDSEAAVQEGQALIEAYLDFLSADENGDPPPLELAAGTRDGQVRFPLSLRLFISRGAMSRACPLSFALGAVEIGASKKIVIQSTHMPHAADFKQVHGRSLQPTRFFRSKRLRGHRH